MSRIKPFPTVYYNAEKAGDFNNLVCPPYDVINDEQQQALYNKSPYNFIRVMLTKSGGEESDEKYTQAKALYDEWLKEQILIKDDSPSLYFYKQEYKVLGQKHTRVGFIGLMKLEDEENAKVHPHEKTHKAAKEDRLKLWSALKSNLSCIFVCFSDTQKKVEKIYAKNVSTQAPFIDVTDDDGVHHVVWRLSDPKLIEEISTTIDGQNLFIADGHHRYEVAKQYRRLQMNGGPADDSAPYNYVMTYFTNMDSKNLEIFPMHRIVRKFPEDLEFLEEFFRVDNIRSIEDLQIMLAKAGRNEHAFGIYTRNGMKLLRLKNKLLIDEHIKEGSKEYRSLDATILKSFVFDKIGIKSDDNIIYTKDIDDVVNKVGDGTCAAGFIMNPVKIDELRSIALNGERMPPKTTYFYPKVLSGLTTYKMD